MELSARAGRVKRRCNLGPGDDRRAGQTARLLRRELECLARSDFRGPLIVEWDRAWLPDLEPADTVLPRSLRRIYEWSGLDRITTSATRTAMA